jgi:hypothetical protein
MIVTTFTVELDIGPATFCSPALPLASDRSRDEDSSSWAVQADRTAIAPPVGLEPTTDRLETDHDQQ